MEHRFRVTTCLLSLMILVGSCAPVQAPEDDAADASKIAAVETGIVPRFHYDEQQEGLPLLERMRHYKVPGISIAVIADGKVAWAKGYGLGSGPEGKGPVDQTTLFQAASISKPVAVTGVMRLVEAGKLDLDEDVNEKLVSWKVPSNDWTSQAPVTLRTLMSHTAGTTVHGFPGYRPDLSLPSVPQILDGQAPANTAAVRVDKQPGEGFRYSGGGTTIVQQLAVDISGEPFPEFMSQQVLEPLGMENSTYSQPLAADWEDQASRAHDQEGQVVEGGWHVYPEMAAAGLWTTAGDLAKLAVEMQKSLAGEGNQILSQETVQSMLEAQNGGPVGLGFFLEGEGDARRFGHGGSNRGFRCRLVAYIEGGRGAAVMTNSARGGALAQEVLEAIARIYEWPGFEQSSTRLVRLQGDQLDAYPGIYQDAASGMRIEVVRQGDQLLAGRAGEEAPDRDQLLATGDHEFVLELRGAKVAFEVQEGRASALMTRISGRDLKAERIPE